MVYLIVKLLGALLSCDPFRLSLQDALNFLRRLLVDRLHLLGESVLWSKDPDSEVSSLLVRKKGRLVLMQEFVLDGHIVHCNYHNGLSRYRKFLLFWGLNNFILDKQKAFHCMVERLFVLS